MSSQEFALAALAVALIGFSKAGLGGGTGILATPLMAIALGPKNALGVMLPLLIFCDWGACLIHHKHWQWRPVVHLLPSCIIGIFIGTCFLGSLNERLLQSLLGVICIGYCLVQWIQTGNGSFLPASWFLIRKHVLGAFTGLSSTLAHAAGPVVAMYLLPLKFSPRTFVATSVLAFTLINLLKLPTYFLLGMIQTDTLNTSLKLAVFIFPGILLGTAVLKRINPTTFKRVIYLILFLTGIDLLTQKSLLHLLLP